MKEICLIDTSWLLNRSHYAFRDFKDTNGEPIGALFGATNFIKTLINRNLPAVFCLDSKSEFRKQINENYKANRESLNMWRLHDRLKELTRGIQGILFADAEGYEADDVIYSLAKEFSERDYKVYVYTTDNDMLQTLKFDNVYVSKKITQNEMELIDEDSEYYKKNYPVHPDRLALYRAFRGDSSDNLSPVVSKMPDKVIVPIVDILHERADNPMNKNNDEQLLKSFTWTESQMNWINKFLDNFDAFEKNYQIMKLNPVRFNIYSMAGDIRETIELAQKEELYQYSEFLNKWIGGM